MMRRRLLVTAAVTSVVATTVAMLVIFTGKSEKSHAAAGNTVYTVASGNWNSGKIWNTGQVPGSEDSVVIHHDVKLNTSFTIGGKKPGALFVKGGQLTGTAGNTINMSTGSRFYINDKVQIPTIKFWDEPCYIWVGDNGTLNTTTDFLPEKTKALIENHGEIIVDGNMKLNGRFYNYKTFKVKGEVMLNSAYFYNVKKDAYTYIGGRVDLNASEFRNDGAGSTIIINNSLTINGTGTSGGVGNEGNLILSNPKSTFTINKGSVKNTGYLTVEGNVTLNGNSSSTPFINDRNIVVKGNWLSYGYSYIESHDTFMVMGTMTTGSDFVLAKNGYLLSKGDLTFAINSGSKFTNKGGYIEAQSNFLNDWNNEYEGFGGGIIVSGKSLNRGVFKGKTDFCDKSGTGKFDDNKGKVDLQVSYCNFVPPAPLPVKLVNFSGVRTEQGVLLKWETASEENNDRFEVQRSANGADWRTIGVVKGNGTTQIAQQYSFVDRSPSDGLAYYRLHQIDFNGADEYHKVISVQPGMGAAGNEASFSAKLYPNPAPANGKVSVEINAPEADKVTVQLLSMAGIEVSRVNKNVDKGQNVTDLSLDGLQPAIYLVRVTYRGNVATQRLMIAR